MEKREDIRVQHTLLTESKRPTKMLLSEVALAAPNTNGLPEGVEVVVEREGRPRASVEEGVAVGVPVSRGAMWAAVMAVGVPAGNRLTGAAVVDVVVEVFPKNPTPSVEEGAVEF